MNDSMKRILPLGVTKTEAYGQLEKVLNSQVFREADRLRAFLRYVVSVLLEETLGQIKEYHVAVEVFGKQESFDPRLDPIVRVAAGRLRSRLKLYFETEGQDDPLMIEIPKGHYLPTIMPSESNLESWPRSRLPHHGSEAGAHVSVACMPFLNLGGDAVIEPLCNSLTEELIDMLTDVAELRVAPRISISQFKYRPEGARSIGKRLGVRFILEGSFRQWKDRIVVKVRIIDASTGFGHRLGRFERAVQDPVIVHTEICEAIVSVLKLRLFNPEVILDLQPETNCV